MHVLLAASEQTLGEIIIWGGVALVVVASCYGIWSATGNREFEPIPILASGLSIVVGMMIVFAGSNYRESADFADKKERLVEAIRETERQQMVDRQRYTADVKAACKTEVSEQFRFYISQADYDSWKIAKDTVIGQCKATGGKAVVPDPNN